MKYVKRYTLVDIKTGEIYKQDLRLKELCEVLDRGKSSVYGTIYRIETLHLFENIKKYDGTTYKLVINKVIKDTNK